MRKLALLMTYMIEFTVCALIGWLYEEALELIVCHAYSDRGVLHLPLLPIYGFGGLLVIFLYRKKTHSALFVFFSSMIATTVLELAASYPIEHFLGHLPWYYGAWPLNYEGRISLISSILFGLLALLLVKAVHPLCRKLEKAPAKPVIVIGFLLLSMFLIDTGIVVAENLTPP